MFITYEKWLENQKDKLVKEAKKESAKLIEVECGECEGDGETDCCECGSVKDCEYCEGTGMIDVSDAERKDFEANFSAAKYLQCVSDEIKLFCEWTGKDLFETLDNHGFEYEKEDKGIRIRDFPGLSKRPLSAFIKS